MPDWQRAYLAVCAALVAGPVVYVLCDFGGWPMLMAQPYEGTWVLRSSPPDPAAMAYPGMVLWGAAAALVAGVGTWLASARRRRPVGDTVLQLAGGWALTACGFAAAYYVWALWPF